MSTVLWALMVLNVNGGYVSMAWMFTTQEACEAAKAAKPPQSMASCMPIKGGFKP